jgi:hypothetical protein
MAKAAYFPGELGSLQALRKRLGEQGVITVPQCSQEVLWDAVWRLHAREGVEENKSGRRIRLQDALCSRGAIKKCLKEVDGSLKGAMHGLANSLMSCLRWVHVWSSLVFSAILTSKEMKEASGVNGGVNAGGSFHGERRRSWSTAPEASAV